MNIYISHSTHFDYQKDLYKPLRESDLNNDHALTLPHEDLTEQFNTKEYLKICNLVIAEVSFPSTGQGIELGWANVYHVPIVCIHKIGSPLSSALKVVSNSFIKYSDSKDLVHKLTDYVSALQHS